MFWNTSENCSFFMAYLDPLPTIYVKGKEERPVYYTVDARELEADGWRVKGAEPKPEPKPVEEEPKEEETTKPAPKRRRTLRATLED